MSDRELTVNLRLEASEGNKQSAESASRSVIESQKQIQTASGLSNKLLEETQRMQDRLSGSISESIQKESAARRGAADIAKKTAKETIRTTKSLVDAQERVARAAEYLNTQLQSPSSSSAMPDRYSRILASINALEKATDDLVIAEQKRDRWLAVANSKAERHAKVLAEQIEQKKKLAAAEKQLAAAERQLASSRERMLNSISTLSTGITQLARSYVLLTAANSDSAREALKLIVRFEATMQALRGTITLIKSASNMWKSYETAVLAASAADLAKATTGGVASGGAVSGGLAFVAGSALSNVRGAAVGAGRLGLGAAKVGGPIAATYYLGRDVIGGLGRSSLERLQGTADDRDSFSSKYFGPGGRGFGITRGFAKVAGHLPGGDLTAEVFKSLERIQGRTERGRKRVREDHFVRSARETLFARLDQETAGFGLSGVAAEQAKLERAQQANRDRRIGFSTILNTTGTFDKDQRHEAREGFVRVQMQAIELEKERHRLVQAASEAELHSARDRLTLARETLSTLEKQRNMVVSEARRFATMNPLEQRRLLEINEKVNRGEKLTVRDAKMAGGFKKFAAVTEQTFIDVARDKDGGKFIEDLNKINALDRKIAEAKIDINTKNEIVIKFGDDVETALDKSRDDLNSALENIVRSIKEKFVTKEELGRISDEIQLRLEQN